MPKHRPSAWLLVLALGAIGCRGTAPTYWSAAATRTVDDLAFVTVVDQDTGAPRRLFALGYDTHDDGPWDGVTGADGCYRDADGTAHGFLDSAREMNEAALAAGANFAYVWSGRGRLDTVGGQLYGVWHDGYGVDPAPELDVVPVIYNGGGTSLVLIDNAGSYGTFGGRWGSP